MDSQITIDDLRKIEAGINEKYAKVATSPEGQFKYPTGSKGLEALNYDKALTEKLPNEVASSYCGVGNPFSLGKINQGEQVLDIGCGAGVDTILAAIIVGPKGSVIGETGFNSTPKTKGVLLRAEKPALPARLVKPSANTEQIDKKVHPAGNLTRQVSRLLSHIHYNLCNLRNLWIKILIPLYIDHISAKEYTNA